MGMHELRPPHHSDIEAAALLSLLSVGVLLLDDEFGASTVRQQNLDQGEPPRSAESQGGGAPFASYEVEVCHDKLPTEAWFQQLAKPSDGSS